jgi:hypothetical protein
MTDFRLSNYTDSTDHINLSLLNTEFWGRCDSPSWEDDGDTFINVAANCSVTRLFYEFVTGQVLDAVSSMKPGVAYCLPPLLDLFLWSYLSEEGRRAAQHCVEHAIHERGLPLVSAGHGLFARI